VGGVALGFAFLAKMLEGLMVAPALAAAYLVAAPTTLWARLRHVLVAAVAFHRLGGLVRGVDPAVARVVASVHRGFDRQQLHESGVGLQRFCPRPRPQPHGLRPPAQVVGSAAGAQLRLGRQGGFGVFGDQSQGWSRLFGGRIRFRDRVVGARGVAGNCSVVLSRGRAPRTDLTRAAAILFGGWLVVDGLVLSFMHGAIHAYYCLSIAPPVAAMFAIGVHELWQRREKWLYRAGLAVLSGAPASGAGGSSAVMQAGCPSCGGPSWRVAVMRRDRAARAVD
jgi:hypothetical protein